MPGGCGGLSVIPALKRQIPGMSWLARPVQLASTGFIREPAEIYKMESNGEDTSQLPASMHTYMLVCPHTCGYVYTHSMHTHTHISKRKRKKEKEYYNKLAYPISKHMVI